MVFLKIRKNWAYAGSTPLLRALLLHGAAYYFVLCLTFALQIIGSMNNKVGGHHPLAFLGTYLSDLALLSPGGHQVCGDVLRSHIILTIPTASQYAWA